MGIVKPCFRGYGKRLVPIDGNAMLHLSYRERAPDQYDWCAERDADQYGEFEHWE